jgi:LysM repeat protein
MRFLSLALLLCAGCTQSIMALKGDGRRDSTIEELRSEIADLKHALNGTKVELQIVEEKMKSQQHVAGGKGQPLAVPKNDHQLVLFEKKLQQLERTQEKTLVDLKQLSMHAQQTTLKIKEVEDEVGTQTKRLDEVSKLRSTLSNISTAMQKGQTTPAARVYTVKKGDSLEKIAQGQAVSVDALRKANSLSSDQINIGQELKLP